MEEQQVTVMLVEDIRLDPRDGALRAFNDEKCACGTRQCAGACSRCGARRGDVAKKNGGSAEVQ